MTITILILCAIIVAQQIRYRRLWSRHTDTVAALWARDLGTR